MVHILSKLFIPRWKEYQNSAVRRAYGKLCSILGIVLNVLLFIGKYVAGVMSGSVAIMADAFNNLSDAGSSFITLVGFWFSGRKADEEHPFGHGRYEYVSGFVVSIVILLMGFELLQSSVDKIVHPKDVKAEVVTVVILLVSIAVKMYMAYYNSSMSKKIDSAAMKATATDSLSDSVATIVVLISMMVLHFFHINIDGWCGVLVAGFILYAGYCSARETLSPLLGEAPDKEYVERIKEMVMAHEEIVGIHDLVVHDYGPGRRMISLHAEVPGNEDVFWLHDAIDCVEMELKKELECEAVIHMDPIVTDDETLNAMKAEIIEKILEIDKELTIHDFRLVKGPTHSNVIFDVVMPFSFSMTKEELKEQVEQLVYTTWEDTYPVIQIDNLYV